MPKLKEGTVTLAELKKVATELKIKGRSKMKKKELIDAIEKAKGKFDEEDMESFLNDAAEDVGLPKLEKTKKKSAPKKVPSVPAIKRQDSPTRIDKSKMKELKQTGRYKPGRPKYRGKTPDKSSGYAPF